MSVMGTTLVELTVTRKPLAFRETDLRRAIRAAAKENAPMTVEIDPSTGKICLTPLTKLATPKETNPWDN